MKSSSKKIREQQPITSLHKFREPCTSNSRTKAARSFCPSMRMKLKHHKLICRTASI